MLKGNVGLRKGLDKLWLAENSSKKLEAVGDRQIWRERANQVHVT